MVSLAVLATAFVGVRLHHEVAALRYAVYELDAERGRAERELRLAQAEYEAAKSPRRLLERWNDLVAASSPAGAATATVPAPAPSAPAADPAVEPPANPADDVPAIEPEAPSPAGGEDR
jgi:hypothetical protein